MFLLIFGKRQLLGVLEHSLNISVKLKKALQLVGVKLSTLQLLKWQLVLLQAIEVQLVARLQIEMQLL